MKDNNDRKRQKEKKNLFRLVYAYNNINDNNYNYKKNFSPQFEFPSLHAIVCSCVLSDICVCLLTKKTKKIKKKQKKNLVDSD